MDSKTIKNRRKIVRRQHKDRQNTKMPLGKYKGRPLKELSSDYLRWAVRKDFDMDLLFSLRTELKKRKTGESFSNSPFQNL